MILNLWEINLLNLHLSDIFSFVDICALDDSFRKILVKESSKRDTWCASFFGFDKKIEFFF